MKIYRDLFFSLLRFFTFVRKLCLFLHIEYILLPISHLLFLSKLIQKGNLRKFRPLFCLHICNIVVRFNLCNDFEKKSHKSHFPMPFHTGQPSRKQRRVNPVYSKKTIMNQKIEEALGCSGCPVFCSLSNSNSCHTQVLQVLGTLCTQYLLQSYNILKIKYQNYTL